MAITSIIGSRASRAGTASRGALASIRSSSRNLWQRVPVAGNRLGSSLNNTVGMQVPLIGGLALGNVLLLGYLGYRYLY